MAINPMNGQWMPVQIAPPKDFFQSDTYKTMQQQMPGYEGFRNADGSLKDAYTLKGGPDVGFTSNLDSLNTRLGGINLNTQALQALRGEGLRSAGTPSAWGQMALSKAMSDAGAQGNAALASGMSALASRGGVSRGARERMASRGTRDTMMAKQKAGMDIGMQDEANRLGILSALPGQEVQSLQPELQKASMWSSMADTEAARKQGLDLANRDYSTSVNKANLASLMGDVQGKQAFDMSKYQETMKAWGADRTASAQENAGK
jgi:hypothetical protein